MNLYVSTWRNSQFSFSAWYILQFFTATNIKNFLFCFGTFDKLILKNSGKKIKICRIQLIRGIIICPYHMPVFFLLNNNNPWGINLISRSKNYFLLNMIISALVVDCVTQLYLFVYAWQHKFLKTIP